MKCTAVLKLAVVLSRDYLYSPQVNMHRQKITHVMCKMIIDDSAFLFNQWGKKLSNLMRLLHSN